MQMSMWEFSNRMNFHQNSTLFDQGNSTFILLLVSDEYLMGSEQHEKSNQNPKQLSKYVTKNQVKGSHESNTEQPFQSNNKRN